MSVCLPNQHFRVFGPDKGVIRVSSDATASPHARFPYIYIERRFLAPIIDGCLAGNAPPILQRLIRRTLETGFSFSFIRRVPGIPGDSKWFFFRARTHFSSVLRANTVSRFLFFSGKRISKKSAVLKNLLS